MLIQDRRYAIRGFIKRPAFAVIAITYVVACSVLALKALMASIVPARRALAAPAEVQEIVQPLTTSTDHQIDHQITPSKDQEIRRAAM